MFVMLILFARVLYPVGGGGVLVLGAVVLIAPAPEYRSGISLRWMLLYWHSQLSAR